MIALRSIRESDHYFAQIHLSVPVWSSAPSLDILLLVFHVDVGPAWAAPM